jgi:hypothetical protein
MNYIETKSISVLNVFISIVGIKAAYAMVVSGTISVSALRPPTISINYVAAPQ